MSLDLIGAGYCGTQEEINHQEDMFFAWPGDAFSFKWNCTNDSKVILLVQRDVLFLMLIDKITSNLQKIKFLQLLIICAVFFICMLLLLVTYSSVKIITAKLR